MLPIFCCLIIISFIYIYIRVVCVSLSVWEIISWPYPSFELWWCSMISWYGIQLSNLVYFAVHQRLIGEKIWIFRWLSHRFIWFSDATKDRPRQRQNCIFTPFIMRFSTITSNLLRIVNGVIINYLTCCYKNMNDRWLKRLMLPTKLSLADQKLFKCETRWFCFISRWC